MLAELQKCPTLFSSNEHGIAMARMSADAQRLCVSATTINNVTIKKEYDEESLKPVKEKSKKGLSWDRFFEELQASFNNGKVNWQPGQKRLSCRFGVEGEGAEFELETDEGGAEDGQKVALEALLHYHFVHTHPKEIEKQLEEASKREAEARQSATDLEREEANLSSIIARAKEQDEVNKDKYARLQKELETALANKKSGGGELDDDEMICRARNPLQKKDHKDYDVELLRLVKSKWIAEVDSSPYNVVARPYTSSELAQHTSNWSSAQRQKLWATLETIDEWDFDVFSLQSNLTGDDHYSLAKQERGGALFYTTYALMWRTGLMAHFKINEQIMLNWCSVVEAGYHGNPYHNSMHAADVLHIMHYIMTKGGLVERCQLRKEDLFAGLFSAAIHDYDHPGVNNSFHVRTQTYYATLYNDRSVLENRHVSSVFELMKLPKFNIFAGFPDEIRTSMRDTIVDLVLATDMGLHTKYVGQWKRRIQEDHNLDKKDDQRLAMQMMLKMADISNCGRPHKIYRRWGEKISDEFYMQGDRERQLGLPISPFMNRKDPTVAKSQIDFMNFVVLPMFESISDFLPNMRISVKHTEENKQHWMDHGDTPPPA